MSILVFFSPKVDSYVEKERVLRVRESCYAIIYASEHFLLLLLNISDNVEHIV